MPLVNIRDMLHHARRQGYALGGFAVSNLDELDAVITAAEACRSPVMLGISHRGTPAVQFGALLAAAEHVARHASVPVGLRYEYAAELGISELAIRDGCNGIAVDVTQLTWPDKQVLIRQIGDMTGACGIPLEAMIGLLPAEWNDQAASAKTESEPPSAEAIDDFVQRTGVDSIALVVEPGPGPLKKSDVARQYFDRVNVAVSVPLVVYGANALQQDDLRSFVAWGVAAVHFTLEDATSGQMSTHDKLDKQDLQGQRRDELLEFVQECVRSIGCAERAAEVLADCPPWEPVEHVIVFNVESDGKLDTAKVLAEGREVLSKIPGVRYVYTGQAITSGAAYQFCWLVRFVHAAVIDSYREHPAHKKFADELFRPIAPSRMSIDFHLTTSMQSPLHQDTAELAEARQGVMAGDDSVAGETGKSSAA